MSAAFSATSASGLSASSLTASANKINEGEAGTTNNEKGNVLGENENVYRDAPSAIDTIPN